MSFWDNSSKYGVRHTAMQPLDAQGPKVLLVFVHGLFGDCARTWGNMPAWVLDAAGTDIDVASFDYPARMLQKTSIPAAAQDLHTWLQSELASFRHLLFVTHSTGGLVVKQMLRESFLALRSELARETLDYSTTASVWLRSRRIINIAVPHTGGAPFLTAMTKGAYLIFFTALAPVLTATRFLSQGAKDWGKNEIIPALRWRNPWLCELEADFVAQQQESAERELPAPVMHDIIAQSDLAVPLSLSADRRKLFFRGTHKTIKVPSNASDPIVAAVAKIVSAHCGDTGLSISHGTIARIAEVNRFSGSVTMIAGDAATAEGAAVSHAKSGHQAQTHARIIKSIHARGEQPRRLVLTGAAGVGKSYVARMIAWRLSRDYLAAPQETGPLPLFIPMQQVTLGRGNDDDLWTRLRQWWTVWVNSIHPDAHFDPHWLDQRFDNRPTAVILDGLDDFLANHPDVGLPTVVTMLQALERRYAGNPALSFTVVIRAGFPGLHRLADDPRDIHEILRLSTQQAEHYFPSCQPWLSKITDQQLLDLVLTPLILSNFDPGTENPSALASMTRTAILEQSLRPLLRRTHLLGTSSPGGTLITAEMLEAALGLIAWLFFYRMRGELHLNHLREEGAAVWQRWHEFLAAAGERRDEDELLGGFALVLDRDASELLARRTVFIACTGNSIRFAHRHWQEFLLARYFYACLRRRYFADFGITAFNSHIYRMVGDLSRQDTVDDDQIRVMLDHWRNTGDAYVPGNVIAFLAWTTTTIDAQAIQRLTNEYARFEPLSRMLLIAGLGYRILNDRPEDKSLSDLKRMLCPKLAEFADPARAPVDDPAACSLAWCYQRAFAEKFGLAQPQIPWPALGFDADHTQKALPMICTVKDGQASLDSRSRSLQLAFLTPIYDACHDPNLSIRAVHYLYYLVVARKHAVHAVELSQELPDLLNEGCEFENVLESFELVPEVLTLYRRCQEAHRRLETALPT